MVDKTLQCSVLTPESLVFEARVEFVVIPAHDGEIGILYNRAPLLCKLGAGKLRVRSGGTEQSWFIDGGFAQVIENKVVVLTQRALRLDEIDREKAAAQLAEAQHMKVDSESAALRKAHLEASARAQLRLATR